MDIHEMSDPRDTPPSYRQMFEIHASYVQWVAAKARSALLLPNFRASGEIVEASVREFLSSFLPRRFRVTHGHIVRSVDQRAEPVISRQIDVIIVDSNVLNSLFVLDPSSGLEVVPVECVCGIIEVKKRLTIDSLFGDVDSKRLASDPSKSINKSGGQAAKIGALPFLFSIEQQLGIDKTTSNMFVFSGQEIKGGLGVTVDGFFRSNPLVGVIALEHDASLYAGASNDRLLERMQEFRSASSLPRIDMVSSLDGFLLTTAKVGSGSADHSMTFPSWPSQEWPSYSIFDRTKVSGRFLLAQSIGFLVGFLDMVVGRRASVNSYFFHSELQKLVAEAENK
jgi:hypothetical protein